MTEQVKLINTSSRSFNGIKAGKHIYVNESEVAVYERNGFERIDVIAEAKSLEEQAELDKANADLEEQAKLDADAKKQEEEQAKLDAEYKAKQDAEKTGDEDAGEDAGSEETKEGEDLEGADLGEDLDGGSETGEETKEDAGEEEKAETPANDDLDAFSKDLEEQAPAKSPRKR